MRTLRMVLIWILGASPVAAEPPLTREQEQACGAILCLAGGSGVAQCAPYLARFYATHKKDRKEFLSQCPTSDLSSRALAELARYGQRCQPERLAAELNRRICTQEQKAQGLACRDPSPTDWRALCASFYAELTDEEPPRLLVQCDRVRDDSGAIQTLCSSRWVQSDYEIGSGCKDQGASCQERFVGASEPGLAAQ